MDRISKKLYERKVSCNYEEAIETFDQSFIQEIYKS